MLALLALVAAGAPAQAAAPLPVEEPQCMPVYREYDFGAVRYVSRDTCSAEVYVDGQQVWPPVAAQSSFVDGCVLVVYIADYHWTYLCVEPKDTSCPAYIKSVSGNKETRNCLVGVGADVAAAAADFCVPTSGGMDYHSYLCVDANDPRCPAYTLTSSDSGTRKTCVGVGAAAPAGTQCMDVYHRQDVGPVTYESVNSCEHQVYVFGKPLLG